MTLSQAAAVIKPPCRDAMARAQTRWDSIAKPLASLGRLEEAVVRIAGMTRTPHIDIGKRCVAIMCADNGVVAQGVTQTDAGITAIMTGQFALGNTTVCVMARAAEADIVPVDIGVAREVNVPGVLNRKIRWGTGDMTEGPAMTREEALAAVEAGIDMALSLKEKDYRLICTGEMGIGNTTTSSAMASVMLGRAPEEVTGRGAGLDDEGLGRKVAAIRKAVALNAPDPDDALDVLSKVGGLDIAGMAGLYIGGAAAGIPVVIDGFISAVAALTAVRLVPACRDYMLPSHVSAEPAGAMMLEALGFEPLLTCGMCLGEGTGAVAALPVLDMAAVVYKEMSTFGDIAIQQYVYFDTPEEEEKLTCSS